MSKEKVAVYISKELYERVKKFIETQGGFSTIEEFVEFVLNEVISEEPTSYTMSKEDEEKVKERLRALGYI
ncbi:MAG: CopG family transcriptional regulator [Thermoprotei archaeon]|nr:MAG: CopG family transcriptional regulator [Thermoprotei archaeon]